LGKKYPGAIVSNMSKELRTGKVFIDWSQNDDHKTTICVYSLRAKERPFVSAPLNWDEVERSLENEDTNAFFLSPDQVIARVKAGGDLFEPVLRLKQKLTARPEPVIEAWLSKQSGPLSPAEPKRPAKKTKPSLKKYQAKRHFEITAEPAGE